MRLSDNYSSVTSPENEDKVQSAETSAQLKVLSANSDSALSLQQADDTIAQSLGSKREQIIEECKAVMREELDIYRAETLSASAARVAIEQCMVALDALKNASNICPNSP
jgi:hypothetical protein